jgi:hypothetical protein
MIEFLLWAPDRETFIETLPTITLPDDRSIARVPAEYEEPADGGSLIWIEGITCSELGPVVKVPAVLDEDGNELEPVVMVPGHHVNVLAEGAIAGLLTAGMPTEGDIFERTRLIALLGGELWWALSGFGEPPGYVGPSGVKIFDPSTVAHRARVFWT